MSTKRISECVYSSMSVWRMSCRGRLMYHFVMGLSAVTMRHLSTCLLAMCVIIILWVSGWLNQASSPSSESCVSTVDDTDTLKMTVIGCHLEIQRLRKLIQIFAEYETKRFFSLSLNCWRKHKVDEEICASIRDCYVLLWISSVGFLILVFLSGSLESSPASTYNARA